MLAALKEGAAADDPDQLHVDYQMKLGNEMYSHQEYLEARECFANAYALLEGKSGSADEDVNTEVALLIEQALCQHVAHLAGQLKTIDTTKLPLLEKIAKTTNVVLAPDRAVDVHIAIGRLYGDLGRFDEAKEQYDAAARVYKSDNKVTISRDNLARARWMTEWQWILNDMQAKLPGLINHSSVVPFKIKDKVDPRLENVVATLEAKKFDDLNKLIADIRNHRQQYYEGTEVSDFFFDALGTCQVEEKAQVWSNREKLLADWQRTTPNSTAPQLALASYFNVYASVARGESEEKDVQASQWYAFYARLYKAALHLHKVILTEPPTSLDPAWITLAQNNLVIGNLREDDFIPDDCISEEMLSLARKAVPSYDGTDLDQVYYMGGRTDDFTKIIAYVNEHAKALGAERGDEFYTRAFSRISDMKGPEALKLPGVSLASFLHGQKLLRTKFGDKTIFALGDQK